MGHTLTTVLIEMSIQPGNKKLVEVPQGPIGNGTDA